MIPIFCRLRVANSARLFETLGFWTNLLWVLLACARGWAALSLYKMQEEDA